MPEHNRHDGVRYLVLVEARRSLGRVIVTMASRGTGAGHLLVDEALRKAAAEYPGYGHRIQAQAYLERFYGSHGFEPEGEVYLEDGIPHIDMTLTPRERIPTGPAAGVGKSLSLARPPSSPKSTERQP
jgi:predicted GNAT family N-acyltransferase